MWNVLPVEKKKCILLPETCLHRKAHIYLLYLINVYACKYISNIPLDHSWFHLVLKNSVYFAIIIIKLLLLLCSLMNIFTSVISDSVPK